MTDGPSTRRALVIDIGSASASALVVERAARGGVVLVARDKEPLRLQAALAADGALGEEACGRTLAALQRFAMLGELHGCTATLAVATEAMRRARNGDALVELVAAKTGVQLVIIDGHDEARLVFAGMRLHVRRGALLGIDLGGGSTEFAYGSGAEPSHLVSVPLGAVSTAQALAIGPGALSPAELQRARARLDDALAPTLRALGQSLPLAALSGAGRVVGTSGTVQRIARLLAASRGHALDSLDRVVVDRASMAHVVEGLAARDHHDRSQMPGMDLDRVDTLLPGALLLERIAEVLGLTAIRLGTSGLRMGLGAVALGLCGGWRPRSR